MRQNWRLIASPSPVPPYLLLVDASACENASNRRPSCASVIPMPVSVTVKVKKPPPPAPPPCEGEGRRRNLLPLPLGEGWGEGVLRNSQLDPAALGELGGVGEQVEERLPDLGQVGSHLVGAFRADD